MNLHKNKASRIFMTADDRTRNVAMKSVDYDTQDICSYCGQRTSALFSSTVLERAAQMGLIPMPRPARGGGSGEGLGGECICPQCGHTESHATGDPCTEKECPKCGAAMIRRLEQEITEDDLAVVENEEMIVVMEPEEELLPENTITIRICGHCLQRALELVDKDVKVAAQKLINAQVDNADDAQIALCPKCGHLSPYDGNADQPCPVCGGIMNKV